MRRLMAVRGITCIEYAGHPEPVDVKPGPPPYYRDGRGDIRVYAPDGQNHLVNGVAAEDGGGSARQWQRRRRQ